MRSNEALTPVFACQDRSDKTVYMITVHVHCLKACRHEKRRIGSILTPPQALCCLSVLSPG
jgi:hypothetical protein